MGLKLVVTGANAADDLVASATRELLRDIRTEADPQAQFVTQEGAPGSKGGDFAILGQIALALVTGGAVGKLIESTFTFLGRNRKLTIEIVKSDGRRLKFDSDFVNKHTVEEGSNLARSFLEGP
jgi:hypothetical protein